MDLIPKKCEIFRTCWELQPVGTQNEGKHSSSLRPFNDCISSAINYLAFFTHRKRTQLKHDGLRSLQRRPDWLNIPKNAHTQVFSEDRTPFCSSLWAGLYALRYLLGDCYE